MDRLEAIARVIARTMYELVERNPDDEALSVEDLVDAYWGGFVPQAEEIIALDPEKREKKQPLTFL